MPPVEPQQAPGAYFDDSLWPLLSIRLVGELSHAQLEEFLDRSTAYLMREERHITLLDTSRASNTAPPDKRRRQAQWMAANEALFRERALGSAFVIHSTFLRLATRAFMHLKPLPSPYIIASNTREAAEWAAMRFDEVGLSQQARRVREHFGLQAAAGARSAG
jgi:hypothetical protein